MRSEFLESKENHEKHRQNSIKIQEFSLENQKISSEHLILNSLNIKVDRPTPIDFSQSIETPDWSNNGMFGCMPPRDVILTVGNEMLEAPMSYRCRWFEYLAYRPLLEKYYSEDKNMRWESAPKPRLTNQSYKSNYLPEGITEEERYKKIENRDMILTEKEPLFDAAEILRFGKDLFYHNNFTSNLSGLDWLRRHYPNHRVHQINLPGDLIPTHIDACFTPIKPGVIIINPNRKISSEQRKIFDDNKWDLESYTKLNTFNTIEEFSILLHLIKEKHIQNGMFFLMREKILPMWESEDNKDGGCFSLKVFKQDIFC